MKKPKSTLRLHVQHNPDGIPVLNVVRDTCRYILANPPSGAGALCSDVWSRVRVKPVCAEITTPYEDAIMTSMGPSSMYNGITENIMHKRVLCAPAPNT